MGIKIYGYSDDLIEVDGDISAEFEVYGDVSNLLVTSNGCVFKIVYDMDGRWVITPIVVPSKVTWHKVDLVMDDDNFYTDVVTVENVRWIVMGSHFQSADLGE